MLKTMPPYFQPSLSLPQAAGCPRYCGDQSALERPRRRPNSRPAASEWAMMRVWRPFRNWVTDEAALRKAEEETDTTLRELVPVTRTHTMTYSPGAHLPSHTTSLTQVAVATDAEQLGDLGPGARAGADQVALAHQGDEGGQGAQACRADQGGRWSGVSGQAARAVPAWKLGSLTGTATAPLGQALQI